MVPEGLAGQCTGCGRTFADSPAYQFQTPDGVTHKCRRCAMQHAPMLKRSALIALVVGTVLAAINQGDMLIAGQWAPALAWKLPMTYAVPFIVATLGALGTGRVRTSR